MGSVYLGNLSDGDIPDVLLKLKLVAEVGNMDTVLYLVQLMRTFPMQYEIVSASANALVKYAVANRGEGHFGGRSSVSRPDIFFSGGMAEVFGARHRFPSDAPLALITAEMVCALAVEEGLNALKDALVKNGALEVMMVMLALFEDVPAICARSLNAVEYLCLHPPLNSVVGIKCIRPIISFALRQCAVSREVPLLASVCKTLWALTDEKLNVPAFIALNGLKALTEAMKRFDKEPKILVPAMGALTNVGRLAEYRKLLVEAGALKRVMAAIHFFPTNSEVLLGALAALTFVVQDPHCRRRVLPHISETMTCMSHYLPSDPTMMLAFTGFLMSLALDPTDDTRVLIKPRFAESFGSALKLVIQTMETYPNDKPLILQCLTVMENLSKDPFNHEAVGQMSMERLIFLCTQYERDTMVLSKLVCLFSAVAHDSNVRRTIVALGGVAIVVTLMQRFRHSFEVMVQVCRFVRAVAISDDIRLELTGAHIVPTMIDCARAPFGEDPALLRMEACGALASLARSVEGKHEVLAHHGLDVMQAIAVSVIGGPLKSPSDNNNKGVPSALSKRKFGDIPIQPPPATARLGPGPAGNDLSSSMEPMRPDSPPKSPVSPITPTAALCAAANIKEIQNGAHADGIKRYSGEVILRLMVLDEIEERLAGSATSEHVLDATAAPTTAAGT